MLSGISKQFRNFSYQVYVTFLGLEMFLSTAGLLNYCNIFLEVIFRLESLILEAMPVCTMHFIPVLQFETSLLTGSLEQSCNYANIWQHICYIFDILMQAINYC